MRKHDDIRGVAGGDKLSRAGTSLVPKKRNMFFLDPRMRKDDRRGGVAGGGFFHRP